MQLSHELSIDMILDHKGRLPPNIKEFLPKDLDAALCGAGAEYLSATVQPADLWILLPFPMLLFPVMNSISGGGENSLT